MKLTKSQENWLREHWEENPKQLAQDTGLSVTIVKNRLKKIRTEPVRIETPTSVPENQAVPTVKQTDIETKTEKSRLAGFIADNGSIIMTPGRSEQDDKEFLQNLPVNKEYWEAHKDHIIIMEKNKKRVPVLGE